MQLYTLTNLLNPSSFSLSNVTVSDGVYTFKANCTAMVNQSLSSPTINHKYYGRVGQMVTSGTTFGDGRFEYFSTDNYRVGNIVFTHFSNSPTDGVWRYMSNIEYFTSTTGSSYILRSFSVNSQNPAYRKEHMIIDLTTTFGSGNEPTQAWCDANIPYFTGTLAICIPDLKMRVKYNNNYIINNLSTSEPITKTLSCINKNMADNIQIEIYSD